MSTIHCHTPIRQAAAPAVVPVFNLYDVNHGIETPCSDKPRDAVRGEVVAYLDWLALNRGIYVPDDALYDSAGIHMPGSSEYLVSMPGYGVQPLVTCEILGDDGETVRTIPLPIDNRGKLPMTAEQVQGWTGLEKMRKARATAKRTKPAPVDAIAETPMPVALDALLAAIATLVERVASLESIIAQGAPATRVDAHVSGTGPVDARDAYIATLTAERDDLAKHYAIGLEQHYTLRAEMDAERETHRDAITALLTDRRAKQRRRTMTAQRLVSARAARRTAEREGRGHASARAVLAQELARLQPIADAIAAMHPPAAPPLPAVRLVASA